MSERWLELSFGSSRVYLREERVEVNGELVSETTVAVPDGVEVREVSVVPALPAVDDRLRALIEDQVKDATRA